MYKGDVSKWTIYVVVSSALGPIARIVVLLLLPMPCQDLDEPEGAFLLLLLLKAQVRIAADVCIWGHYV